MKIVLIWSGNRGPYLKKRDECTHIHTHTHAHTQVYTHEYGGVKVHISHLKDQLTHRFVCSNTGDFDSVVP